MRKNFNIVLLMFSLIMLCTSSIILYISDNMTSLKDKTLDTYTNLEDYSIIIPKDITTLNDLDDDSLNLLCVYVDRTLKTINLSIIDNKVSKESWIYVPETKRTYINISDSSK